MILNKQKWNNEQIENNFFCLKRNKAQKTVEIEIAFHPKYYPFWRKKPLRVCSFINAGLRVVNLSNRWTNRWMDKASIHGKKISPCSIWRKKNELVKEACKNFGLLVVGRVFLRSYYLGNTKGLQYVFFLLYSKLMYLIVFGYFHIFTN